VLLLCTDGVWDMLSNLEAVRNPCTCNFFFFFFTLVTGPRRSLSLKLSDARVCEPQIRARLGTSTHFCEVVDRVLLLCTDGVWDMLSNLEAVRNFFFITLERRVERYNNL